MLAMDHARAPQERAGGREWQTGGGNRQRILCRPRMSICTRYPIEPARKATSHARGSGCFTSWRDRRSPKAPQRSRSVLGRVRLALAELSKRTRTSNHISESITLSQSAHWADVMWAARSCHGRTKASPNEIRGASLPDSWVRASSPERRMTTLQESPPIHKPVPSSAMDCCGRYFSRRHS